MPEPKESRPSSTEESAVRFDVVNETLVREAMLIEASAGTGKTYSLERLVARLVVEKAVPIQSLLIMTFTRAATAELSARIRKILMKYRDALREAKAAEESRFEAGDYDETDRKLLAGWLRLPEEGISECIDRLSEAVNRFDDAAIFTIHSFCQRMLVDYVFSRGGAFEMTLGNDDAQVAQALDEVLRSTYAARKDDKAFVQELQKWKGWDEKLARLKSQSMADIDLDVFAASAESPISDGMKAWVQDTFRTVPDRIRALKQVSKTLTFDDLLLELWMALRDGENRSLVDSIRQRFKAVLVDEFQDTDPIQFNILKKLFLDTSSSSATDRPYVFFVGDPKQAIYGFRSAELETYLQARQGINRIRMLDTNFRSTPALVQAVNTFFCQKGGKSRFLNNAIQYEPVNANPKKLPLMRKENRDVWSPVPAFELWTNTFDEDTFFTEGEINQWLAKAIATDIVSLLDGTVYYCGKPLEAKDIAILVKRRTGADAVIRELAGRGVRTRLNSNESVFQSTEAIEILAVLDAMIAPDRLDVVTAARATRLVGHSLKAVQDDESGLQAFREFIKAASQRVMKEGVYPVFMELMRRYDTDERLLPLLKGARMLANYHHLLELMQVAQQGYGDLMGITHWLRKTISDNAGVSDDDAARLRIESDDNLVNIVTIHASKGLEYPVVYLCDAVGTRISTRSYRSIFREDRDGRKCYVLTDGPMSVSRHPQTREREEQELVRLAYVGMTRASARLVLPLVLGVAHQAKKDFSSFSTDSIASAYVRALYAEPVPYSDKTNKRVLSPEERLRKNFGAAVQAWRGSLEKSGKPVEKAALSKAEEVIHFFQESFPQDKDYQQYSGVPLKPDLTAGDFYRWRHVSSQDDDREIPVSERNLIQEASRYQVDTGHGMPKTWGRTSFSGINRKLATEKLFPSRQNGYAAFPKGTVAGDFLHKLIEKAINQRISVSGNTLDGLQAFIDSQMEGKPFFAAADEGSYQKACLERLGYRNKEGPASFSEYCARWIGNCLRILFTRPMAVEGTQIDLGALVRDRQVVPEIDFMLTVPGKADQALDVESLVKGLDGLSLKADPSVAKDSLKGYLTGQIDLLLKNDDGRYWVIDWKSNAIDTETDSCDNPGNYTQEAMEIVMDEHHYRLQALCYTVALFRYLQQRHPERTADEVMDMIGGAIYVFLRGVDEKFGNHGIYSMPIGKIRKQVQTLNNILSGQSDCA